MYDLGDAFKPDLDLAKTDVTTIFKGDTYRITVLSESLIRFEHNPEGVFEDRPTERVICRKFKTPMCTGKIINNILLIDTKYMKVEYATEKPFSGSKILPGNNLRVTMVNTDKWWYYGNPEARNFGGTSSTIDDGKNFKLELGLFSPDGFATLDDSDSLIIDEGGAMLARPEGSIDVYLFMYNKEYNKALSDYFRLTGMPPMIPRYALGAWYGKDNQAGTTEIIDLINRFKMKEIPLSVFYLNEYWGLPAFTWNKNKFNNPKDLIDKLHNQNIKLGLYINPTKGIEASEELYNKATSYLEATDGQKIPFAPYNPKWLDVYLKLFLHPLEAVGVDFFINNMQTDSKLLSVMNRYHYLDHNRSINRRGLTMARNGLKASHRYPIHYSGNLNVGWETLAMLPKFNYVAANVGLSWISNDIAGYSGGTEDADLYRRFIQFGCFSPIFRFNSAESRYYKREPWLWDVKTYTIAKEYMQLRYRLIPYIYSEAYKYHKTGTPLIMPLYYNDLSLYDSSLYSNQYMFGSQLLVAPIVSPSDELIGRTVQRFYLPEGIWYDFKTGKRFMGQYSHISFVKDEDYPVFVKAGAIIPMSIGNGNDIANPQTLVINIFPGANNKYYLYEDDGETNRYLNNDAVITEIDYKYEPNNYNIGVKPSQGKINIIPANRNFVFKLNNTKDVSKIDVKIQGRDIPYAASYENNILIITVANVPTVMPLSINCSGENIEYSAMRLINDDIDDIIQDLKVPTSLKEKLNMILFSQEEVKRKRIKVRKLKHDGLDRRTINIFLRLLEYVDSN